MAKLRAFFFDIGGTLGDVDPTTLKLTPYPSTLELLQGVSALGVKIGVISNTPPGVLRARVRQILKEAHLDHFFTTAALITSADVGKAKPDPAIYQQAAAAVGLELEECVYFGEAASEVAAAIETGMQGILKP